MTRERTVREQLHGFPENLEEALRWDPGPIDCDGVLLCGMGGSAISGAIAADFYSEGSSVPLVTVKSYGIPAWAGGRTLAIVSSYSGNTLETLHMYMAARKAGCRVIAITAGGRLKDMCDRDGVQVRLLPDGMQPRHSIGYMIGYTMSVLERCGCRCLTGRMDEIVESLKGFRDSLESQEGTDRIGSIADRLSGHVPVIVAGGAMQSVAFRWKTQINENSKCVAFCGSLGEYDYDSVCRRAEEGSTMTVAVLGPCDVRDSHCLVKIDGGSEDVVEDALRILMIGDHVSIRMAERRGVDPEPVAPIKSLKRRLSGMPDPGILRCFPVKTTKPLSMC